MAQGSGGYGGPNFSGISAELTSIAIQFQGILTIQRELGASLDSWRNLEKQLTLSNAAAQGTRQEFERMEIAARNFALVTNFNAAQVANSLYNLVSAGLSVREALAAASGVLLLSQASLTDLGEAADITASSITQFGLAASDSTRISNLFVASTNSSLSTVAKLAFALRQVGPVAAQSNLSLEQTVGILDKLFDAGLRGEQAGTALRNVLTRLQAPQGQSKDLLDSLGIKTIDVETGRALDRIAIFKQLAAKNLSGGTISILAGLEGVAGFQTLLKSLEKTADGTTTELERHIKSISGTDAAYKQAIQQAGTLDGSLNRLSNSYDELRIILAQQVTPTVHTLSDAFAELVNNVRNMQTGAGSSLATYGLFAAALVVVAVQAARLPIILGNVAAGIVAMRAYGPAVAAAAATFNAAGGAAGAAAVRTAAIGTAATSAAAGFTSIIGTVAGLGLVAAALVGIATAIYKVQKAKEEAARDNASQNFLTARGQSQGLSQEEIARLAGQTDISGGILAEINRVSRGSSVDADTGTGAFDRARRYTEEIKFANDEIKRLDQQAKIFGNNSKAARDSITNALEILQNSFVGSSFSTSSTITGTADSSDANSLITQQITGLRRVSVASDANVRTAVRRYFDERIATIKATKSISEEKKNVLLTQTINSANAFNDANDSLLIAFRDGLAKGIQRSQTDLSKISLDDQGGRLNALSLINKFATAAFNDAKTNSQLTDKQVASKVAAIRSQQGVLRSAIGAAISERDAGDANVITELKNSILTTSNVQGKRAQELAKFLKALPDNSPAVTAALQSSKLSGYSDLSTAVRVLGEEAIKKGKLTQAEFKKLQTAEFSVSAVNEQELNKVIRDNRETFLRQQIQIRTLAGENTDSLINELVASQRKTGLINATQAFVDKLSGTEETRAKLAGLLESKDGPVIENAIQSYYDATAQERVAIEQKITDIFAKRTNLPPVSLSKVLEAFSGDFVQASNDADKAKAEDVKRKKAYTDGLLSSLPSAQENERTIQQLVQSIGYTVNDYLNVPSIAIERAIGDAKISQTSRAAELSKKFQNAYVQTITRDIPKLLNDPLLQQAFKGDNIAELVARGSTTFNGKTFTDLNDLIVAIGDRFENLAADTIAAGPGVEAARTTLRQLAAEVTGSYDLYIQQLRVLAIKDQEAQNAAREYMQGFDTDALARVFQQAAASSVTDAGVLTLTIDIAVKARTAKIELDGERAVEEIRKAYVEALKLRGVPVFVNAKGDIELAANVITPQTPNQTVGASQLNASDFRGAVTAGMREAFDSLRNRGLSATAAAGIVGALTSESGLSLNPNAKENDGRGPGVGIAQWTEASRKAGFFDFIEKTGSNSRATQLDYLWQEMSTKFRGFLQEVSLATTPEQAERLTTNKFLRPNKALGIARAPDAQAAARALLGQTATQTTVAADDSDKKRQLDTFNQLVEQFNTERERQRKLTAELKAYQTDAARSLLYTVTDTIGQIDAAYDKFEGETIARQIRLADRAIVAADIAQQQAGATLGQQGARPEDSIAAINAAVVTKIQAQLNRERLDVIAQENRYYFQQKGLLEQQANSMVKGSKERKDKEAEIVRLSEDHKKNEDKITEQYRERINLVPGSKQARDGTYQRAIDALQQQSDSRGGNQQVDILDGMRQALLQFAKDIPTVFATAAAVASTALNGIADIGAKLFTGASINARQAVADILSSMAQLIAKMLIMYATLQLIRLIPGGSALLSALDFGAGAKFGSGGIGGGYTSDGVSAGFYADGGTFGPNFSRDRMHRGGVRAAHQPATAVFGEGQYPEAFIPMLDRKTVKVVLDANGNALIPLPSGESIPVSMDYAKKYALGGVGGPYMKPYSRSAAIAADNVIAGSVDAVSRSRGPSAGNPMQAKAGNTYVFGDMNFTVNGDVNKDNASLLAQQMTEMLTNMLDARDSEQRRNNLRRRDTLQNDWGIAQ